LGKVKLGDINNKGFDLSVSKDEKIDLEVKRCPECFISLPLDAKECPSCHAKVGKADKHGKALKKTDWISYVACIISWTILFLYVQWAFLSPPQ